MASATPSSSKAMKTVCIVVLMAIQGSIAVPRAKLSRFLAVDKNQPGTFEITSNINKNLCIEQCKANSECMLINFHTRQKVCSKIFHVGTDGDYHAEELTKPGYLCWEKDPSRRQSAKLTTEKLETTTETTTETTSVMPEYSTETGYIRTDNTSTSSVTTTGSTSTSKKYGTTTGSTSNSIKDGTTTGSTSTSTTVRSTSSSQETTTDSAYLKTETETGESTTRRTTVHVDPDTDEITVIAPALCEEDPDHEYCEIYCKPPEKFNFIEHYGNMYTMGSKQAYDCYDQNTQQWHKQVMTCTEYGSWTNTDNVCSYHYPYKIKGRPMMFKFVELAANKNEALDKCQLEKAHLIKINYKKVLRVLKENLDRFQGSYWADVYKRKALHWYTSDNQKVPQGGSVWHQGSWGWLANIAVNHKCAIIDNEWLLLPKSCHDKKYFICEMLM